MLSPLGPLHGRSARGASARCCGSILLTACGARGVSPQDADRSMKQYELAIGLQGRGQHAWRLPVAVQGARDRSRTTRRRICCSARCSCCSATTTPRTTTRRPSSTCARCCVIQASDRRLTEESLVPDAHNGLGVLYIHQKRYPEAVERAREGGRRPVQPRRLHGLGQPRLGLPRDAELSKSDRCAGPLGAAPPAFLCRLLPAGHRVLEDARPTSKRSRH